MVLRLLFSIAITKRYVLRKRVSVFVAWLKTVAIWGASLSIEHVLRVLLVLQVVPHWIGFAAIEHYFSSYSVKSVMIHGTVDTVGFVPELLIYLMP